jgi:hypothetical protein
MIISLAVNVIILEVRLSSDVFFKKLQILTYEGLSAGSAP